MSKAAFDLSRSQGDAVLGLLERAGVAPLPAFYKLFYDYVAGVKGLIAERLGDMLEGGEDQGAVGDRVYAEFIAPYENKQSFDRALDLMLARLATLDRLLVESTVATARHSRTLTEAGGHFGAEQLDAALLREWVLRLELNNRLMVHANHALATEIAAAQRELAITQAEIGRSHESRLRDPLTGIANRAGLDLALTRLIAEAPDQPLCVAVIDVDHFKALNDGYGHQVGDEVLRLVGRALLAASRESDIVGRTGGDEFVAVLGGTALSVAHNVADGMRSAVAASELSNALGADVLGGITASIGVAQYQPGEPIAAMLDRADRCLYRAKQGGRNRVDSFAPVAA